MAISRGYEPVSKLEFNIMANRRALAKMGFTESEITKVEIGLETRKQIFKSIKRRLHPSLMDRLFKPKEGDPPALYCDICGLSVYVATEGFFALPIPHGMVIDYNGCKVYTVCGACQLKLGLEATESGLLIHTIQDGHGYVDLEKIERLIEG